MYREDRNLNAGSQRANSADCRELVYQIDDRDFIVSFNGAWQDFALEADCANLTVQKIRGRRLWDFVRDSTTREIYRTIHDRVRRTRKPVNVPFRCDGPAIRRHMEMSVSSAGDQHLEFRTRTLRIEHRAPVALLDHNRPISDKFLLMCGWCKQIDLSDGWVEVEEAVKMLELFEGGLPLPGLSHGICPSCKKAYFDGL
jgi:hypothetical protein